MQFQPGNKVATGGKRTGAGRKPEEWKRLHDRALKAAVSEDDLQKIYEAMVSGAKAGSTKAAAIVLERVAGKVPTPVDVTSGGEPIKWFASENTPDKL